MGRSEAKPYGLAARRAGGYEMRKLSLQLTVTLKVDVAQVLFGIAAILHVLM